MPVRVVILSSLLLSAEGIAGRLRQHLSPVNPKIINLQQPNLMSQIIAEQPSIVILDMTDPEAARSFRLSALLRSRPATKIIYLDMNQEQAQVVTSQQCSAVKVRDLAEVIKTFS